MLVIKKWLSGRERSAIVVPVYLQMINMYLLEVEVLS